MKKGDALTLTFESAVKALHQIEVNTWLDEPENAVTLKVTMQAMPDGLSYPGNIVLRPSEEAARGSDHEVELPEDRAVAQSPVGRTLLIVTALAETGVGLTLAVVAAAGRRVIARGVAR